MHPVHLVCLVCLVEFDQPDEQNKPNEPEQPVLNLHPLNFFVSRHQLVPDLHHQLEGHIGFL